MTSVRPRQSPGRTDVGSQGKEGSMLTTPLTMDMLQSLLDVGVEESTTLDFKSDFDVENADHRRGLIDDACAMANTRGGSILLGVVESDRAAIALPGLMVGDLDRYRLRLSQMIENGLEPRLFGVHIELVAVSDGRYIVAVRIPQSWVGPHRTTNGPPLHGARGRRQWRI